MSYSPATEKFAFAGDSHIYVFDCKDGAYILESNIPFCRDVEEIMAGKQLENDDCWSGIGIKCIDYSIQEPRILAACALRKGVLEFWDTHTQTLLNRIQSTQDENSRIREIKWSPHTKNEMMVINFKDQVKFLDVYVTHDHVLPHTFKAPDYVETGEWHPRQQGKILLASSCNMFSADQAVPYLVLFEIGQKHTDCDKYYFPNDNQDLGGTSVVQIAWNLGEDVFLAVLSNGGVYLFAQDERFPKMSFDRQNIGVATVTWIDNISGDFLTSSKKTGALRIWNAANPQPRQIIKVSNHGILTVRPIRKNHFMLQLNSGAICIYDLKAQKIRFSTDVCHTAQVQDCQIHPSNPDLMGTVSFDGTLRVWDLKTMKLDQIFTDRGAKEEKDRIMQCLAWYNYTGSKDLPQDEVEEKGKTHGKLCVFGTSAGWAKLVDLNKNKIIWKQNFEGACIYGMDWFKDGTLAIAPTVSTVSVFKFSRSKMTLNPLYKVELDYIARCLHFSPFHSKDPLLLIGTFDGKVCLKNSDGKISKTIQLGAQRILAVQWHPHIEGLFAVGSFDGSVYHCKFSGQEIEKHELVYHTDRVRSLSWNSEIPWLLITASDDQQVVLWDIRHDTCLASFVEPSLALTQFTCHPAKPFRYFSCHFDSSVMCWSLLTLPEVALSQLKFLLYSGESKAGSSVNIAKNQLVTSTESTMDSSDRQSLLSGHFSQKIVADLSPIEQDALENYESILKFFQVQDGQEEFWNMVSILSGAGPKENTDSLRINHISDITFVYQTKARELKEVSGMKMLGTALAKKEDRLMESANLYLKSGNFQEYCELQKELGHYEEALSVAPKVSLQYWQQCLNQYRKYLEGQLTGNGSGVNTENEVNILEDFVDYSILSGDLGEAEGALEKSGFPQQAKLLRINELNSSFPAESVVDRHEKAHQVQSMPTKSVHQLGPDDKELLAFTNLQAQKKFIQREPLLSASIHLSLNDPRRAIQKLILSNNYEHAFVLAKQFDKDSLDHVLGMLFKKVVDVQDTSVLESILGATRNAQLREVLEIATMRSSEQQIGEIRSQSARQDPQSAFEFIAANRIAEAAQRTCQAFFRKDVISATSFFDLYIMSFFDLSELAQKDYQTIIQAYRDAALIKALYFKMFTNLRWVLKQSAAQGVGSSSISQRVEQIIGSCNDEALEDLIADTSNKFVADNFANYYQFLKIYMPCFATDKQIPRGFRNVLVWLSQVNVTRASVSEESARSDLSGRTLNDVASAICLNKAKRLFLSFEEALDFQLLCPFNFFDSDRKPFNPFFNVRQEPITGGKVKKEFEKQQKGNCQFVELL